MSTESSEKAEKFLSIASQFKLGALVTESVHPATTDLSDLATVNLPEAISILKELDNQTISVLYEKRKEICYLKGKIREALQSGGNIYFCGCGATGRLSLTIETIWRQIHNNDRFKERVFSFMAGGDVALIRSIENFEDFPQYGARQLIEAGFKDGDLLIATTEGGETPFVIGATEKASQISGRKPFFLYCNPDNILCEVAERSKLVVQNPDIEKINLTVGPMAVTGSTRMQSSTILLAAAGAALFYHDESDEYVEKIISDFSGYWEAVDTQFIEKFTILETELYKKGEYLLYDSDDHLGVTIITDTTERSPTFSLLPFENVNEPEQKQSLCYLFLPEAIGSQEAWEKLLWRAPRTLEWADIGGIASEKRLLGFDFSGNALHRRENWQGLSVQHRFKIKSVQNGISFQLEKNQFFLATYNLHPLFVHLTLKMILNAHSTLIMGRMGRYKGNVMTYVRASNNKLIDRAVRYIDLILKAENIILSYSELTHKLYEMIEKTPPDESIVLSTVKAIKINYY